MKQRELTVAQRVFGAGYFKGLKDGSAAAMHASKYQAKINQLSPRERKVFDVMCGSNAALSSAEVHGAFLRCGHNGHYSSTLETLNFLAARGLVKESPRGSWIGVVPKVTLIENISSNEKCEVSSVTVKLIPVADEARQAAGIEKKSDDALLAKLSEISTVLRRAAKDVDDLSLDVMGEMEKLQRNSEKLRHLKDLFSGL